MSYAVYLISSLGAPRNHQSIFVETNANKGGYIFQVTGNIQSGMKFGHRPEMRPEDSHEFLEKAYLGTVSRANYERMRSVVDKVEPPRKQFDGQRRVDLSAPLRRCQEWTAEAICALRDEGVLEC